MLLQPFLISEWKIHYIYLQEKVHCSFNGDGLRFRLGTGKYFHGRVWKDFYATPGKQNLNVEKRHIW